MNARKEDGQEDAHCLMDYIEQITVMAIQNVLENFQRKRWDAKVHRGELSSR
jgi:hypothetical protein